MYDVEPFVKPVPLDFERTPDSPNDMQELMAYRRDRSASPHGERMREFLGEEEKKMSGYCDQCNYYNGHAPGCPHVKDMVGRAKIRALLNEWLVFAKDIQPGCAAGQDYLDTLVAQTYAVIESLPSNATLKGRHDQA